MFEDLFLGIKLFDFVMQQRIFFAFLDSRRAADNHHRGFFRVGFGGGIRHFQSADAISNADSSEPFHACIGVGGETSASPSELFSGQRWKEFLDGVYDFHDHASHQPREIPPSDLQSTQDDLSLNRLHVLQNEQPASAIGVAS